MAEVDLRLQTPQVVDVAADLAHYILQGDSERLEHSRAVAGRAKFLTLAVADDRAPLLVAAAWLHDIGYAPGLQQTGFIRLMGPTTCGQQAGRQSCVDWLRINPAVASSPTNGAWTTPWHISNFTKTC